MFNKLANKTSTLDAMSAGFEVTGQNIIENQMISGEALDEIVGEFRPKAEALKADRQQAEQTYNEALFAIEGAQAEQTYNEALLAIEDGVAVLQAEILRRILNKSIAPDALNILEDRLEIITFTGGEFDPQTEKALKEGLAQTFDKVRLEIRNNQNKVVEGIADRLGLGKAGNGYLTLTK